MKVSMTAVSQQVHLHFWGIKSWKYLWWKQRGGEDRRWCFRQANKHEIFFSSAWQPRKLKWLSGLTVILWMELLLRPRQLSTLLIRNMLFVTFGRNSISQELRQQENYHGRAGEPAPSHPQPHKCDASSPTTSEVWATTWPQSLVP